MIISARRCTQRFQFKVLSTMPLPCACTACETQNLHIHNVDFKALMCTCDNAECDGVFITYWVYLFQDLPSTSLEDVYGYISDLTRIDNALDWYMDFVLAPFSDTVSLRCKGIGVLRAQRCSTSM